MVGRVNIGDAEDYRVRDGALLRPVPDAVYLASAALVIEIVSPSDESWEKLGFYAARGVEELLIVDPEKKTVSWMGLEGSEYRQMERSGLIELGAAELAARIDWP